MQCPRCQTPMQEETLDGPHGRSIAIDICHACQALWFDTHESLQLTPGATLRLFRLIGERVGRPAAPPGETAKCPRCRGRLRRTHDMQRTTRFEYLRCPNGHGRFTTFFDFLREKDFIRPLTAQQVDALRQHVRQVQCAGCGAPVDVQVGAACGHCRAPLSMLDLAQAGTLVAQLQAAEDRAGGPVAPDLPLRLARARRETDQAFAAFERDERFFQDAGSAGLVGAGLGALARWLGRRG